MWTRSGSIGCIDPVWKSVVSILKRASHTTQDPGPPPVGVSSTRGVCVVVLCRRVVWLLRGGQGASGGTRGVPVLPGGTVFDLTTADICQSPCLVRCADGVTRPNVKSARMSCDKELPRPPHPSPSVRRAVTHSPALLSPWTAADPLSPRLSPPPSPRLSPRFGTSLREEVGRGRGRE